MEISAQFFGSWHIEQLLTPRWEDDVWKLSMQRTISVFLCLHHRQRMVSTLAVYALDSPHSADSCGLILCNLLPEGDGQTSAFSPWWINPMSAPLQVRQPSGILRGERVTPGPELAIAHSHQRLMVLETQGTRNSDFKALTEVRARIWSTSVFQCCGIRKIWYNRCGFLSVVHGFWTGSWTVAKPTTTQFFESSMIPDRLLWTRLQAPVLNRSYHFL